MFHIPKICDYLKILTDDEKNFFVATTFTESFKSFSNSKQNER